VLLKDAVRMAPRVVTDVLFWKAAARFAVGSRGVNLLRTMRDDVMK
jgi:hypothetical protein